MKKANNSCGVRGKKENAKKFLKCRAVCEIGVFRVVMHCNKTYMRKKRL